MSTEFVNIHSCLTKRKQKAKVVIVTEPWEDKHGTINVRLIAHTSTCKGSLAP
jgi:hypothetical protein